ncbi:hypothetical protein [Psychroflexus salis]|uniref:Uncharacterized protein n=1 Tax=Psychroflexus salis TaxID=1526574 RepID=A0A917A2N2_9FLAO|nr:hypothetical protein [Psychroflexus salis]GGE22950.1 hypothetical protein GCM10010831_24840 [Psychroflexus salis]
MNLYLKRHKLLEILTKKRILLESDLSDDNLLGVSFTDIHKQLNCNRSELELIMSELYDLDEIGYHDTLGVVGLFTKDKGKSSYANKKYKRLYRNEITNLIKDFVQIIIPILSLLIASYAVSNKIESFNMNIKNKLDKIENQVKELEFEFDKTEMNHGVINIDSISKK